MLVDFDEICARFPHAALEIRIRLQADSKRINHAWSEFLLNGTFTTERGKSFRAPQTLKRKPNYTEI